ncbi:hypothetical protein [Rhizobium sp. 18065]|uniref:hypothetical protein n=1 Tax=Rhizobium sp. 18065 TaxID=2681411 RepID=UPI0013571F62|nr:hypothetical protein [Rhizobium sp. 18065]
MSDCSSHPGVGPILEGLSEPDYLSYNPSEVRLYGRPAIHRPIFKLSDETISSQISEKLQGLTVESAEMRRIVEAVKEVAVLKITSDEIFGIVNQQIVFAIVDHNLKLQQLPVDIGVPSKNFRGDDGRYIKSIGVIYGYAYEGHCYTLPKPQIMYLPEEAHAIKGGDCGCDCGYVPELGYVVWQIDKLERVVALDVRSDDLKTLVLDENMPGNRSPLAYAQTMALAPQRHRD